MFGKALGSAERDSALNFARRDGGDSDDVQGENSGE
jgi:hypothetical protein